MNDLPSTVSVSRPQGRRPNSANRFVETELLSSTFPQTNRGGVGNNSRKNKELLFSSTQPAPTCISFPGLSTTTENSGNTGNNLNKSGSDISTSILPRGDGTKLKDDRLLIDSSKVATANKTSHDIQQIRKEMTGKFDSGANKKLLLKQQPPPPSNPPPSNNTNSSLSNTTSRTSKVQVQQQHQQYINQTTSSASSLPSVVLSNANTPISTRNFRNMSPGPLPSTNNNIRNSNENSSPILTTNCMLIDQDSSSVQHDAPSSNQLISSLESNNNHESDSHENISKGSNNSSGGGGESTSGRLETIRDLRKKRLELSVKEDHSPPDSPPVSATITPNRQSSLPTLLTTTPSSRSNNHDSQYQSSNTSMEPSHSPPCNNSFNSSDFVATSSNKLKGGLGVIGLRNIGNTCFMNASLQCLLATDRFTSYFQNNEHLFNINSGSSSSSSSGGGGNSSSGGSMIMTNPLRRRQTNNSSNTITSTNIDTAQVGRTFYELVKQFSQSDCNRPVPIVPQELKSVVAKNAPWLIGNQQHDSQEFLRYLLDAISEDLKGIQKQIKEKAQSDDDHIINNEVTNKTKSKSNHRHRFLSGRRSRNQNQEIDEIPVINVESQTSNVMNSSSESSSSPEQTDSSNENLLLDITTNEEEEEKKEKESITTPVQKSEEEVEKNESEKRWKQCFSSPTIVEDTFQGQLRSRVQCCVCKHVSFCFDPFLDISVPIPESAKLVEKRPGGGGGGSSRSSSSTATCTLEECLKCFTETEILDDDNRFMCEKCNVRQRCEKRLTIHRWPPVLVIQIKRFQYTTYTREKLATSVKFPTQGLNIGSFLSHPSSSLNQSTTDTPLDGNNPSSVGIGGCGGVDNESTTYDLFGVSNHMGGLGGGHYTANCKHDHLGCKWFNYNDSNVSPLSSERELQSSVAYVLFYKQRDKKKTDRSD